MYQRPVPNPYRDIEPTGNIFTDARKQFVQLFGGAPSSFSSFDPITREYAKGGYHQHKDRFGQLFEEMQADLAEGMDLNQIREKYSQTPEARAYLNFQANYDPATFAEDNPDLAERGQMNAKQAWTAALFTDKIDYNEPGGGFYQEQAEKFLSENDDGRTPATIREYRDREKDDYLSRGGTLRGFMRREPIDPVAVQEREEARRASMTPERRLREDIQSGRVSMEEAREQYPDQFRQAEEMARQDRERRRAEGGIGSLRSRARDRIQQMRDRRNAGRRPLTEDPLPTGGGAGGFGTVDFGDEARAKMPIDYGAADIGGGRPMPQPMPYYGAADIGNDDTDFFGGPQGGGTYASDVIMPGINKPPQFNLPPRTPPGFRPSQGMPKSLLGSGISGMDLYEAQRRQMGTGPVDPTRALTDPYYRFTPATPPVAVSFPPPTPTPPAVEGNVLSEMPGPVNPMPSVELINGMPVNRPFPTDFHPYMAVDDFGAGASPSRQDIIQTMPTPPRDYNVLRAGQPPSGGMSPGQTYQPYTLPEIPMGAGPADPMRALTPRPASGGKGGAQYMGTPPSYGQTASSLLGSGVGGMDLYSRAGGYGGYGGGMGGGKGGTQPRPAGSGKGGSNNMGTYNMMSSGPM